MQAMRIIPAVLGALVITVALFLFMRSLIQYSEQEGAQLAVFNDVQILHSEPEPEAPLQEQTVEAEPEVTEEPTMEPLTAAAPALAAPAAPAAALQIPTLDLAAGDIDIPAVGDRWSGGVGDRWSKALGADAVQVGAGSGTDAQGFVEVVPFDTRRPNVPESAWLNKIDGWVLVAFSVTPDGRTQKVRVLDASPRGVFEDTVIAAVADWKYHVSFAGKAKGDVVMTQKVEVFWRNYPQNLPNVD